MSAPTAPIGRGNHRGSVYRRGDSPVWVIAWHDHTGHRRERSTRQTDRSVAERMLEKQLTVEAEYRAGLRDPRLDQVSERIKEPIGVHVDAYRDHLAGKASAAQASLKKSRLERLFAASGVKTLRGVSVESVNAGVSKLAAPSKKRKKRLSVSTRNKHRDAAREFCRWCVKDGRLAVMPLKNLENETADAGEHRRALSPDEFAWLSRAAESGEVLRGMTKRGVAAQRLGRPVMAEDVVWELDGPMRALLYLFAVKTTLRRGAIERLVVADIDLGDAPMVTVKPHGKEKKLRRIPLADAVLVKRLRDHVAARLPAAPLFDMPPGVKTAAMLRADLEAARAAYIAAAPDADDRAKRAEGDFLAAVDAEGRKLDFHALRHTGSVWLEQAGVDDATARRITGHSSAVVRQKHYSSSDDQRARAAAAMVAPIPLLATGTDDARARNAPATASENRDIPARLRTGVATTTAHQKPLANKGFSASDSVISDNDQGGIRTHNQRLKRPMLCH